MTIDERNLLIERYMSRRMSIAEEKAFHHRLQTDERLRQMLEAEQLIQSTAAKSLHTTPLNHARMRSDALSLAAATPAAAGHLAGKMGIFAGMKGMVILAASTLLVGGVLLFRAAPDSGAGSGTMKRSFPAAIQNGTRPEPFEEIVPPPVDHSPATPPTMAEQGQQQHLKTKHEEARTTRRHERAQAAEEILPAAPEPMAEQQIPEIPQEKQPEVIIRNDTLRTRLRIESLQQRR